MNNYDKEVKRRWGETAAYGEYENKAKDYSEDKRSNISEGMNAVLAGFFQCMKSGYAPESDEAQGLVRTLQEYITENFYTCTKEILKGLGQMYVADERFKKNIDKNGHGTAEFVSRAIEIYCK